jgi:hypothetical protein
MNGDVAAATAGAGALYLPLEGRRDRLFFGGMAVLAALTVFAGFAPTYFLRALSERPPLAPLLHLHGIVFTSWILLFVAQTALVAARRTDIHRRLGVAGAGIALVMLVVGFMAAAGSAARGFTPPNGPPPLVFFAIPVGDLVAFGGLIAAGLLARKKSSTHKRLMLLATIALLPPAMARLPYVAAAGPLAFFGLTDLFVLALLLYDKISRGRVHPASLWGGLFLILSQPLRLILAGTGAWIAFATWVTS